jgi:hypothetical protein
MLIRRAFQAAAAALVIAVSAMSAQAISQQKFDKKAFDEAQEGGKSILVQVHATWCPICTVHDRTFAKLSEDPRFKELISFRIDFDTEQKLWRSFKAQKQSTLIVFKGKKEVGRSVGDTNPKSIEALLAKSL